MKPLALLGLLGGMVLLTACPQTPRPPVNPVECPTGPLEVQVDPSLRLQGMGGFEGEYAPGELLVLPKPGLSLQAWRAEGMAPQEELPRGLLRVKVPPGQEKEKAQALLRSGALYVQPNYLYRPLRTPNDPLYALQQKPYMDAMGLKDAWDRGTGRGCPPVVAVLDTGILPHEDLQQSLYLPRERRLDVAEGDTDPRDASAPDVRGHGLMVASVLGADTHNGKGMAGVTWGGYLVPIKIIKDGADQMFTSDILAGVNLARQMGARVINLSLGAPGIQDGALASALAEARAGGTVVVAASGNGGSPGVYFPANLPGVIAVGAVRPDKARASFSSYGPELSLVAPGVGVVVADPKDPRGYSAGLGTSFASPMVAGVVALYMSKYASERRVWPTPDQVYGCLTQTAEDLGPPGKDEEYGFGLVRADRVMANTTHCFP
ncbi:MAG: S8 family serine peptidase [Thermus sp.]|uniref:S8 family peptidase n=1 Tax=Thermus sp. TaxID=275 RepID=UPI00298EF521|nr:S8 family serine peptidase [Thermus sp.]MDW8017142.1 S8 family serine peptidase [Thermus sp.]